ncbi:MAG: PIN domain-containing protein [Deltaproteobacteria bacterium]|nr:PIN domain-containing protein [Deltaproteobacteria bacterium]
MIILFDTNIVLDALFDRDGYAENAVFLLDAVEQSIITGFLCAHSITTLYYLLSKAKSKEFANQKIKLLFELFAVAPVNRAILEEALARKFADYEDAVVHQAAIAINANGIVTRNTSDFKKATINIYSPEELIAIIQNIITHPQPL